MLLNRDQLAGAIKHDMDGYKSVYFITLNSRDFIKQHQIEDKSIDFNRKIQVVVNWLREYIAGDAKATTVKVAAFYEISGTGNLHAHLIVAMNVVAARSIDDVNRFVTRKWKKMRDNDEIRHWRETVSQPILKLRRWVDIGKSGKRFEWEKEEIISDSNIDVRSAFNLDGALLYSDKEFMHHGRTNQFCSYMLM